jgi:transposase
MRALVVKNKNQHFKGFCDRLTSKGKCAKVIVVAVMSLLITTLF